MTPRLRQVRIIATLCVALTVCLAVLAYFREPDPFGAPLTVEELATLEPGIATDRRIFRELRRQAGPGNDAWKSLPEVGRHVYVTIWVEEMQRSFGGAWNGSGDNGDPSLEEAVRAYGELGHPEVGESLRAAMPTPAAAGMGPAVAPRHRDPGTGTAIAAPRERLQANRLKTVKDHSADLHIR